MITNTDQLEWALDQSRRFDAALESLRQELADSNPALFAVTSKGYERRLKALREDVVAFLRTRPVESPLQVLARGPGVGYGTVPAKVACLVLDGLRSSFYAVGRAFKQRGRLPRDVKVRDVFDLNLVATAPGSFIFSLSLPAKAQLPLFVEYDVAEQALEELIGYVNTLAVDARPDVPPEVLLGLDNLAEVLENGVQEIEVRYRGAARSLSSTVGPEWRDRVRSCLDQPSLGPRTITGRMIAINIEDNKCTIHLDEGRRIRCDYDEELEDRLIRQLKHRLEIAGETKLRKRPAGSFDITRITDFRRLREVRPVDEDEDE